MLEAQECESQSKETQRTSGWVERMAPWIGGRGWWAAGAYDWWHWSSKASAVKARPRAKCTGDPVAEGLEAW